MNKSVDFDLLNEKIHPRKRLKGRKGFKEAGPKGTQMKFSRGKEFYRKYFPGFIEKYQNTLYHGDSDEEETIEIDDGGMDYGRNSGLYRGPRHLGYRSWDELGLSVNKKKRWELKKNLKKSRGYHSHLPNKFYDVQLEVEGEEEDKKESYEKASKEYEALSSKKKSKKKKSRKKRGMEKIPNYQIDLEAYEYDNYYKLYPTYTPGYYGWRRRHPHRSVGTEGERVRLGDKKKEQNRRRIQKNNKSWERRNLRRKKNRLRNELKRLEQEIEVKDQEIKSEKEQCRNLRTKNKKKRRRMKREKKRKTKPRERKRERDEMKEIIVNNRDFYGFGVDERKESMKKFARRPRDGKGGRYDYGDKHGKSQRRKLKSEVRDILNLKY